MYTAVRSCKSVVRFQLTNSTLQQCNKVGLTTSINFQRAFHIVPLQYQQRKFNAGTLSSHLHPRDRKQRERQQSGDYNSSAKAATGKLGWTQLVTGVAQFTVAGALFYHYSDRLYANPHHDEDYEDEEDDDDSSALAEGGNKEDKNPWVIRNDDSADSTAKEQFTDELNDEQVQKLKQLQILEQENSLTPDEEADTYESALFSSSQKEAKGKELKKKEARLKEGNILKRIYFRVYYFTNDCIIEPLFMIERIAELTILFLPVIVVYPITWFGKKNGRRNNERTGALIYYKFVTWAVRHGGASFIKLGQWAASRTDIFPQELCNEMSQLHSNAKPHSFRKTKQILEASFNGFEMDEIFEKFEKEPVGCGAIAQVYMAKLSSRYFPNFANKWVAVKVVHPRVETVIERDLKIMAFFANLIDYIPTMEWLSLPQEVEQFSMLMRLQLDLRIEGYNLIKFQENFKNRPEVNFPSPIMEITNRSVLIEEKIHGLSMNAILTLKKNFGKNLSKEASDILIDSFLQMLILDNFIHSDLHPGNIFVRFSKFDESNRKHKKIITNEEDDDKIIDKLNSMTDSDEMIEELKSLHSQGYKPRICFIDTGLVTELNERNRYNFIELFNALSEFDGYKAGELMIQRSRTPETAIDKELFAFKVERLVDRIKERTFTLGSVSIGDLLDQMLGMVRNHHVRMEGDFVTVIVAILLLEGLAKQLDPDLDLFASSIPILRQLGFQDGKLIFHGHSSMFMLKVWAAFEVRQFINASVHDVYYLVKSDGLCANY